MCGIAVPPAGQQDSRQPGAQLVEQAAAAAKQEGVIRGMDESLAGNASARAAHAMLTSAAPGGFLSLQSPHTVDVRRF